MWLPVTDPLVHKYSANGGAVNNRQKYDYCSITTAICGGLVDTGNRKKLIAGSLKTSHN